MKITVTQQHSDLSGAVIQHINQSLSKLEKRYRLSSLDVFIRERSPVTAEISTQYRGQPLCVKCESTSNNMYKALAEAKSRLMKSLEHRKQRLSKRR